MELQEEEEEASARREHAALKNPAHEEAAGHRAVSLLCTVTAQTGGSAVAPQVSQSTVGGSVNTNIYNYYNCGRVRGIDCTTKERSNEEPGNQLTENLSRYAECEQVMKNPLSTTCGHSHCSQCTSGHWEQSGSAVENACPLGRKRSRTHPEPCPHRDCEETAGKQCSVTNESFLTGQNNKDPERVLLKTVQKEHKSTLEQTFKNIFEGIAKQGNPTLLNRIYTELYITEGEREGVNDEHEVWQIESAYRTHSSLDTPINCNDIFKCLPGQEKTIRTVLTKGIAGIGKTVSVQKFILDWAEGKANQDIDFIFVLPFRELNLIKDEQYSLLELLHEFHPEIKNIKDIRFNKYKVMLIFDGLDESRLPLNFHHTRLSNVKKATSVDVLLTNLIKRILLPSALLWITTRPAAASQIPPEYVDQVTEIRGFNDPQKEEYFHKRFSDEDLANRIISHIQSSRSLYIMCHIPVFCWISATVLEEMLGNDGGEEIPTTLTQMYTHFLLIQTNIKKKKYNFSNETNTNNISQSDRDIIMKLGELAFYQLEKGNVIFYEEDLRECGIDVSEASLYSGVCTQIFKKESVMYQKKVYCFVHLSIQEYIAALYVFQTHASKNMDSLTLFAKKRSGVILDTLPLSNFHKGVVDKALKSKNGHLDLFLRFFLGVSLDSNKSLLQGFLTPTESSSESIKKTIKYIKGLRRKGPSPERCINLLHCLLELNDNSLVEEVQNYLQSSSEKKLSPAQCTSLAYVLLMSKKVLDVFDMKKYNTSEEGCIRLLPVIKCCRKALLTGCKLTASSFETVLSGLQAPMSHLRELDLSYCDLGDSAVRLLCDALKSPNCKIHKLGYCMF
uniref:NACHT domain-containing protein n=1 Tax=Scleropages formosus TaxID=113540 RepID=A0A8D0CLY2_SCLFO